MPKYRTPKDQLEEQLEAARSLETTPDELEILSESAYTVVQIAVAEHPNAEPFTLAGSVPLSIQSPAYLELATALARNNNTPDHALERLAERLIVYLNREPDQERCFPAWVALTSNLSTPFHVIAELLAPNRSGTEFRKTVARETRRRDVLRLLLNDRNETVRKQAAETYESLASA
jgi:hypothetical protein